MTEFVKLKTDSYKGVTKGRYYEVCEEYLDPTDNVWCYMIRLDNMINCGVYPQEDFEKPITHVRCINNEGCWGALTVDKEYEIISINYVGGELITVKKDNGQTGQYSSKRFEFIERGDNVNYTHVICRDNDGQWNSLTYGKKYEIVEMNNSMVRIIDDINECAWYAVVRFQFVTEDTPEILFKPQEPQIYKLGAIAEPLEPLPETKYHITYSLQYAEGAELEDINKANIIQIEGEIVSKGRVWVIETKKGTVIIPFKAIIHMHPQY